MKLTEQLDIDWVREIAGTDLPTPVDVLNLIQFKNADAYRWYGIMVLPLLKLVGADVGWFGVHEGSFLGESQAEELGVVRYPTQRRFLGLALNPYYMIVANPQRLKAVRAFQASFTHSPDSLGPLSQSHWLVAVHHHPADTFAAIERVAQSVGGRLVYRSVETSEIRLAKRAHPANTNPLRFAQTALVAFPNKESCLDAMTPGLLNQLKEVAGDDLSVQLYRRLRREEALPDFISKRVAARFSRG